MGLLDIIVEELNKHEEEEGSDGNWERLYSTPVELVNTPTGIRCRDPKTGRFVED